MENKNYLSEIYKNPLYEGWYKDERIIRVPNKFKKLEIKSLDICEDIPIVSRVAIIQWIMPKVYRKDGKKHAIYTDGERLDGHHVFLIEDLSAEVKELSENLKSISKDQYAKLQELEKNVITFKANEIAAFEVRSDEFSEQHLYSLMNSIEDKKLFREEVNSIRKKQKEVFKKYLQSVLDQLKINYLDVIRKLQNKEEVSLPPEIFIGIRR